MKNQGKFLKSLLIGLTVSVPLQSAIADSFLGNRRDLGNVRVYHDASVANLGYTAIFDDARIGWNSVSSKVVVIKSDTLVSGYDRYFVGDTATAGLLGRTIPYKKDAVGAIVTAGVDDLWDRCTISVYDNQMDSQSMTNVQRSSNSAHEIGHSLKLAHPGGGTKRVAPVPAGSQSLMNQGIQGFGPQKYDKDELIFKWGA